MAAYRAIWSCFANAIALERGRDQTREIFSPSLLRACLEALE